ALACKRRGFDWIWLTLGEQLAVDRGRRYFSILHREQRLACSTIEHVHVSVFRDLRDRVDLLAVAHDGDEIRRGGEVVVPDVVLDALEVPDAPARAGVEREDAVGKQVIAMAGDTVEIERRRTGGGKHHPELRVEGDAGPGVRAAGEL